MKKLVALLCAALLATAPAVAQQQYTQGGASISNVEGTYPTYSATIAAQALQTAAGDVACIAASATKTVRITRLEISGTATGATLVDVVVFMRTALDTGGTPGAVTAAKHNTTDPAATAAVTQYTGAGAPTPGAGAAVRSQKTFLPPTGTPSLVVPSYWDFGTRNSKTIILQPASTQALCLNFNSAVAGNSVNATFEWTEN